MAKAETPSPDIFINEIAWMGTGSSTSDDEWMELKNTTGQEIDLSGWTLEAITSLSKRPKIKLNGKIAPGGYFLLERTDDGTLPNLLADQIYSGLLGDGGETLELKDASGSIVDRIDASSGWPAGESSTRKTMERKDQAAWETSLAAGGTPKAKNSCIDNSNGQPPAENPPPPVADSDDPTNDTATSTPASPNQGTAGAPLPDTVRLGDVVINELVSDPEDGDEWVELYNTTSRERDLGGWTIEDGSGAKTALEGKISSEGKDKYLVIEKPKGNLNNKGDIVILRDQDGNLIDQAAYGDWNDGDKDNNAPAAGDPYSIARKIDGFNSFNNLNDFETTKKITKGTSNIIEHPEEGGISGTGSLCANLLITEILPDPVGEDAEEFIEIFNASDKVIDLAGWRIEDEGKNSYVFKADAEKNIIQPGAYYILKRNLGKIALNNDSDSLKIYEPQKETACRTVKYEKAIEGGSYSYDLKDKNWAWSEIMTPGKENIIKKYNSPPLVDFNLPKNIYTGLPMKFDSSDTIDADDDQLKFLWDFGDGEKNILAGPEHAYLKAGSFRVKLSVSDGKATSTKERVVKVVNKEEKIAEEKIPITLSENQTSLTGVKINEIFPNPAGDDSEGEFIEFWNDGGERANLLNWIVRDASATGRYQFKDDFWIEPDGFFSLKRVESGLALNNDADKVRLFNDSEKLIEEVSYDNVLEGGSYARGENGKWFWTTRATPGKKNVISVAQIKDKNLGIAGSVKGVKIPPSKDYNFLELKKAAQADVGERIKTRGVVAVPPGILGAQFFYIVEEEKSGSPDVAASGQKRIPELIKKARAQEANTAKIGAIQVYNYKKEFPGLRLGDLIEVSGEISESAGEKRIKTSAKDDLAVLSHGKTATVAEISSTQIGDEPSGQLIKISGEITKKSGSTFYIDDGNGEVIGYVKKGTGIKLAAIKEGDQIELTGILNRTESGTKVFPRYQSDIIKIENSAADGSGVEVVGEIPPGSEWELASRDRKLEQFKYILMIAGALIAGLVAWLVKLARKQ